MSIEDVLARALHAKWCSDPGKCSYGIDDYRDAEPLTAAIRAHLLSPAVIARAGLTIWPDATHPDDRAWAEADARAAITAALEETS